MQLKDLTNNQRRKEFLEDYTGWKLWLVVPEVNEKYYSYSLPDNSMIIATETRLSSTERRARKRGKCISQMNAHII